MKRKSLILLIIYTIAVLGFAKMIKVACDDMNCLNQQGAELILDSEAYQDDGFPTVLSQLKHRIQTQPFNFFAFMMFCCAIVHTFFSHQLTTLSKRVRDYNVRHDKEFVDSFSVEVLRFLGEVEVVFGIWVIPLLVGMGYFYDWSTALQYLDGLSYSEPMFVVIIMSLASTRPVVRLAEDCLRFFANIGSGSATAWWWVILTIGPLSGSLITEPGAMTISSLLLGKQFYELKPSKKFAYATLGLLFTNVSVGGVFTNFAAPPVLMVSKAWGWDSWHMLTHFGWKALTGIILSNFIYYFLFKSEFLVLDRKHRERMKMEQAEQKVRPIPFWISLAHLGFLAWTVVHVHHPVVFVGSFLLFLGFYQATLPYQHKLELKPPILVGLFLAGLVVHGSLQAWWIAPLLGKVSHGLLLVMSAFLTSFNDNAEITFLATLIPSFDTQMKYAVMAGAVTGGGLTVIANAPNPLGQSILNRYFPSGISALYLAASALLPATIVGLCFYFLYGI